MKKNNYEVLITAFASVLVIGAKNQEEALKFATENCRMGDMVMDEASIKMKIETKDVQAHRRMVDVVSEGAGK